MYKLTLKQANTIIEHALAKGHENKFPPLAVVVLDDSGHIKAAQPAFTSVTAGNLASHSSGPNLFACR